MGLFSNKEDRIHEAWSFDVKTNLVCSPSVTQSKNGTRIVIGTKDGRIVCLDAAGAEVWTFNTQEELSGNEKFFVDEETVHCFNHPPVLADINHDNEPEILAGTELGILYCISMEGKLIWKHDVKASIHAAPAVEDINMDGHPEILIGSQDGKMTALSASGEVIFEYITAEPVESTPGVMKSGGKPLIVYGTTKGNLYAITPGQEVVWTVPLKSKITAQPVFFSTAEERRLVVGTMGGTMYCVSEHGEIVWEFKTEGSIYNKATIADLDDDNIMEIVFGSCDNNVYAVTMEGKRMWSYETDFWVTDTPLVGDVNNDGKLEVVVGSFDHNVYVLDSKGEYMMDYVPGISGIVNQAGHYTNVLTSDPGEQTGKKLYMYKCKDIVVGCALVEGKQTGVVVSTKSGQVATLLHG